jgi:hypothetical protein
LDDEPITVLECVQVEIDDLPEFFMDIGRLCSMLGLAVGRWFAPLAWIGALGRAPMDIDLVDDIEMIRYLKTK